MQRINHAVFSSRRTSAEVRLRSTSMFLGKNSSSSSSSLFECCHANTIGWIASDGLLKQHTRPGWTLSPLALSCANDLAWASPLALSPLAKMCLGVGLTCDSIVTHTHTQSYACTLSACFVAAEVICDLSLLSIDFFSYFPSSLLHLHLSSTFSLLMFLFLFLAPGLLSSAHLSFTGFLILRVFISSPGTLDSFFPSLRRNRLNSISDRHQLLVKEVDVQRHWTFSLLCWSAPLHWLCTAIGRECSLSITTTHNQKNMHAMKRGTDLR